MSESAPEESTATVIGVISDTHGWLDPRATKVFQDAKVEVIVHAGDVGSPDVLWELKCIAPVVAVAGNVDCSELRYELSSISRPTIAGLRFFVVHDQNDVEPFPPDDADVVVRGHTHAPAVVWHGSVLVVNPGSATQRRSMPSCSVALIEVDGLNAPVATIVVLDDIGPRVRPTGA